MPRKSKKKSPPTELMPATAVLDESPVAEAVASPEPKPQTETEPPVPEHHAEAVAASLRQREREQSDKVPTSFADAVKASRAAFAPIAEGFVNVDSFPAAGLKVNRSLDRKVAAIQFAEDRPLSRASEYDKMREIQDAGFQYKSANRQWERFDAENPGGNLLDAKRIGAELAKDREGQAR